MSLSHSPKIVTDGIVFAYDMANTQKSWKGMTATNLVSVPTKEVLGISSEFVQWGDIAPVFNTYGTGTGYSLSLDLKSKVPGPILVYMQNGSATKYSFVSQSVTATTSYQRFRFNNLTAAISDPAQTAAQLAFYGVYGTGRIASVRNVQIEKNAFATPFVDGARTNTQSILDLTGLNTITANSLTYASDNTFSFNGTSDYITAAHSSAISLISDITIVAWIKVTNFSTYRSICAKGTGALAGPWDYYLSPTSGRPSFYRGNGTLYSNHLGTTGPASNIWQQIAVTMNGNGVTHYLNGEVNGTGTITTTIGDTNNPMYIGSRIDSGTRMSGNISVLTLYNRALSETEIKQNFNALRGRYGL